MHPHRGPASLDAIDSSVEPATDPAIVPPARART
jgi:hypothetical protein